MTPPRNPKIMGLDQGLIIGSWLGQDLNPDLSSSRLKPVAVKGAKAEAVGPGS